MTHDFLRIVSFGGCTLHNPLSQYYKNIYKNSGLKGNYAALPFSLSGNTNHQLVDMLSGKLDMPGWVRSLAYVDSQIERATSELLNGDIVLLEMSTPTEYDFEGVLLNINRFEDVILAQLDHLTEHRKLITKWKGALRRANEPARKELAGAICQLIDGSTPDSEKIARFVRDTSARMLSTEEMVESVGTLKDRLGLPVAMLLHNFSYMPDGRAVPWPAAFHDQSLEVASKLGLPIYDPAHYVRNVGTKAALMDDRRHWRPGRYEPVGELFYNFCEDVLAGRPIRMPSPGPKPANKQEKSKISGAAPTSGAPAHPAPQDYNFDSKTGGWLPCDRDVVHAIIVLGGGWANGSSGDVVDGAVSRIPEHSGAGLMFDGGVRPRGRSQKKFIDLCERAAGSSRETPCAGIADQVLRQSEKRFKRKPKLLLFSIARNKTTLSGQGMSQEDGLMRGSPQHRDVLQAVQQARIVAAQQGLRLEVAAICLLGGERETADGWTGARYRRTVSLLQMQYDADLRLLTGQTEPVRLYLSQTSIPSSGGGPEIAHAQLVAQQDNCLIQCIGPIYFAPPEVREKGRALYSTAPGYRRIGQLFGRYVLDDLWGPSRMPVQITDAWWTAATTLQVRFSQSIALETDNARITVSTLDAGLGLHLNDGTNWPPPIVKVSLSDEREDELTVEFSRPPIGHAQRLTVAGLATEAGPAGSQSCARSAIRARHAYDIDPLDGTELFEWACTQIFELR